MHDFRMRNNAPQKLTVYRVNLTLDFSKAKPKQTPQNVMWLTHITDNNVQHLRLGFILFLNQGALKF